MFVDVREHNCVKLEPLACLCIDDEDSAFIECHLCAVIAVVGFDGGFRVVQAYLSGLQCLMVALSNPIVWCDDPNELSRVPVGQPQYAARDHIPLFVAIDIKHRHGSRGGRR